MAWGSPRTAVELYASQIMIHIVLYSNKLVKMKKRDQCQAHLERLLTNMCDLHIIIQE